LIVLFLIVAGTPFYSYFGAEPWNPGIADRVEVIKSTNQPILYRWYVKSGPMFFIFVVDAPQTATNMAAAIIQFNA